MNLTLHTSAGRTVLRRAAVLAAVLLLAACSSLMPPTQVEADLPPVWHAPRPHQGDVADLTQWWQRQGDPVLVELISAAQTASPTVAAALARIAAAQAQQAQARSALLPNVNAQLGVARGVSQPGVPVATTTALTLAASWELDLVGANRAVSDAAQAQLQGTQALWHDARVSVAAEVASVYHGLLHCRRQWMLAQRDASSRTETARLTTLSAEAGLLPPAAAALARAAAAEGYGRVSDQQAQCEVLTKSLVALTALPEPTVRARVEAALAQPRAETPMAVTAVPAQTIAQRPDVFAAERDVVVASARVGSAQAQRLPRLSLSGSIGALRVASGGAEQEVSTWSLGPLALSLPLFDAGQRAAAVQAAQADYDATVAAYRARVRNAVREVEEALVRLHSTRERLREAGVVSQGFREALAATQVRHERGLASRLELEDAQRQALATESAELGLQLERTLAWLALYRALGGGFAPTAQP